MADLAAVQEEYAQYKATADLATLNSGASPPAHTPVAPADSTPPARSA